MALIGWAGGLLGAQVQFLQVAAGLDVAGADAGAEADAGMCRSRRSAVSEIAAFEAGERSRRVVRCSAKVMAARSEASWRARAPPTTTPGSHISREGMKPFTKPPKMTTSKVWPKRSSGAAMATAGTSGSEFLPHGAASFRIEDGAAALFACFAVASRGRGT